MRTRILHGLFAGVLVVSSLIGPPRAGADDVRIQLSSPDEFVMRNFMVTRTSSQPQGGLVVIKAFDRESRTFTFEDVSGATVTVPVAEIRSIGFRQDIPRPSPQVQAPLKNTTVSIIERRALSIPAGELALDGGALAVGGLTPAAGPGERWEANTLEYDGAKQVFTLRVSRMRYVVTYPGGGGGSPGGPKKTLP